MSVVLIGLLALGSGLMFKSGRTYLLAFADEPFPLRQKQARRN